MTDTAANVSLPALSITLQAANISQGITLDTGGDVDTEVISAGNPAQEARATGNGKALSGSGNSIPDGYMQFNVDDSQLANGKPTSHVSVEVDYYDQGLDSFSLQYDALPGSGSDGLFAGGGSIFKTNTLTFKTAVFNLCDANFGNRDNGADFRISDNGDGRETIHAVRVMGLPDSASIVNVDDFGANPFDGQPDSGAIQSVLDSTCSGATIVFTSPANNPDYKGYLIDRTLFLTGMSAKHDLTFTSSDPNDHALLRASADLKGFVVRLFSRSRFSNAGDIDDINFGNIDVNGGRDVRVCLGPDQVINGVGDNWGSWLPECTVAGDPWCSPGNIGMDGALDNLDVTQDYQAHPSGWTTGVVVHDLVNSQAECGTALAFGGAAGTIQNVTIDTAGDHVHAPGCTYTDDDGDQTGWSDGITLFGPAHTVSNNTIINPSDVGIVYFGGKNTLIANNTIRVTQGNYGAFAGIALHPWSFGDVSGVQIMGNQVTSEGDTKCGGLHAGINLGPQMWGGACVSEATGAVYGNSAACSNEPDVSKVAACTSRKCQLWAYLPADGTLTMKDNTVTGANINYLVEGLDVLGQFIDRNNVSQAPRVSDWQAARSGCNGVTWGALDKVAHHPSLTGYTDLLIHCER
ncbi:MAG: right-handed parallel beta-helix repeat-containing protein [Chloroflexi bacterium]|nr:right-handed parallel beta-helix repeat-containing protein [Chloroflexota bacterium]